MASYRLLNRLLKEHGKTKHDEPINSEEFLFSCGLFKSPGRGRAELLELEKDGYISSPQPGFVTPTYRGYHWRKALALRVVRFIGLSIVTPILVTLLTLLITGKLQLPT